ncbi:hypothetical protein B0A50_06041 [Salinomyces thailandicus]|uniref:DUF2293 domain-containing protein n=1 Tax=Salinomyces thailandicus TaxID=706561 RepID=A0A4U0TRX6_9PEZI|nr:hypothetical protein B0A50_06041 [Salinomyces thailandica]
MHVQQSSHAEQPRTQSQIYHHHQQHPRPREDASPAEVQRRREWNRGPLTTLFPRIPTSALETALQTCITKDFVYNLSAPESQNARRYTYIIIAQIRHQHTDYERLLREDRVERFEARRRTGEEVWRVLRAWCPWDRANGELERCWRVTMLRPEERGEGGEPMEVDSESEAEAEEHGGDPMDLD